MPFMQTVSFNPFPSPMEFELRILTFSVISFLFFKIRQLNLGEVKFPTDYKEKLGSEFTFDSSALF